MPRFTDAQLIQIMQKAARRVNRELCLFDTTDEITISASGVISPTDGTLEDLVLLQSECLLAQRDFSLDLNSSQVGLLVKDGEQTLDNRAKGAARGTFFESEYGPCAQYKKQIVIEKLKRTCGYDIW
jgi:hypothetical protein